MRTSHAQGNIAGPPVRAEVHHHGKAEEEQHATLAAKEAAYEDQERGKRREQCCGFECVAHGCFICVLNSVRLEIMPVATPALGSLWNPHLRAPIASSPRR